MVLKNAILSVLFYQKKSVKFLIKVKLDYPGITDVILNV